MDNSAVFVQDYIVYILEGGHFIGIKVEFTNIKLETLFGVDSTPVDVALCYRILPGKVFHLTSRHKPLLEESHFLKQNFLSAIPKKTGANVMFLLPKIIEDFKGRGLTISDAPLIGNALTASDLCCCK
ncbi:hypothetical protein F4703DRAFT_1933283 [Phycomyces blakesleeanus]